MTVAGMRQDQRALSKVGEQDGRKHDGEPGEADRAGAEMPAVGVERLRSGHRQDHGAEGEERSHPVIEHEACAPGRRQSLKHAGVRQHLAATEQADRREPHQDHRPEQPADGAGAVPLDREQPDEDSKRDRDDKVREAGRCNVQPLHG